MCLPFLLSACGGDNAGSSISAQPRATASESDSTTGSGAVSAAPTAIAGTGQSVFETESVLLQGNASAASGRTIRRVQWLQDSRDTIRASLPSDASQEQIRFLAPQVESDTALTFIFRVEDDVGNVSEDKVLVYVKDKLPNQLPVPVTGSDFTVNNASKTVTLNGCDSFDRDGTVKAFQWREITSNHAREFSAGCRTEATLSRADASDVQYVFELTVTDDQNASASRQLTVTQTKASSNTVPVVTSAQANPSPARPGETIELIAQAMDAQGHPIQYLWEQIEGPPVALIDKERQQAKAVAPANETTLKFRVRALDGATTADAADSRVLEVPVQKRAVYNELTPQQCLATPTREGCFTAAKMTLASNAGTAATGLAAASDSAGSCNPKANNSWPHFWGALHEHTAYSDGTELTKPAHVFASVKSKGFDFAFSTDHSDNMGLPVPIVAAKNPMFCTSNPLACVLSDPSDFQSNLSKWDAVQAQAIKASTTQFTAIRGFEWTSDRYGHANVLMSTNFINPKTGPGYAGTMDAFWQWFVAPYSLGGGSDGLLVFNHPGREDSIHGPLSSAKAPFSPVSNALDSGDVPSNPVSPVLTSSGDPAYTFNDFAYIPQADYRVVGVEVFGKGDEYDTKGKRRSWYAYALDKGWYLAPTGSEDHHETAWGDSSLPKTVIIARTRSQDDLREAMLARRMYAVAQQYNDIKLEFFAEDSNGKQPMGSRIASKDKLVRFSYAVTQREGRKSSLDPNKLIVELYSSQGAKSAGGDYMPVQTSGNAIDRQSFSLPMKDTQSWAFLRVRDASKAGNPVVAVSAPIWFKPGSVPLPSCNSGR